MNKIINIGGDDFCYSLERFFTVDCNGVERESENLFQIRCENLASGDNYVVFVGEYKNCFSMIENLKDCN